MMTKEPTNADRAEWGRRIAENYASMTGLDLKEDPLAVMGDLLADLMHLCNFIDVSFEDRLRMASCHHGAEIAEDPPGHPSRELTELRIALNGEGAPGGFNG